MGCFQSTPASVGRFVWIRSCGDRNCSWRANVPLGIGTLIANILVLFFFTTDHFCMCAFSIGNLQFPNLILGSVFSDYTSFSARIHTRCSNESAYWSPTVISLVRRRPWSSPVLNGSSSAAHRKFVALPFGQSREETSVHNN